MGSQTHTGGWRSREMAVQLVYARGMRRKGGFLNYRDVPASGMPGLFGSRGARVFTKISAEV